MPSKSAVPGDTGYTRFDWDASSVAQPNGPSLQSYTLTAQDSSGATLSDDLGRLLVQNGRIVLDDNHANMSIENIRNAIVAIIFMATHASGAAQSVSKSVVAPESASSAASETRKAELLRQLAELERRIEQEGGQRIRYISAFRDEEPFKSYYQRFTKRIEKMGTENLPKRAGKSVLGKVLLHVRIDSTGHILDIEVMNSDDKFLTRHSVNLLRSAEPLEPFSHEMKGLAEIVVLSVPFSYSKK